MQDDLALAAGVRDVEEGDAFGLLLIIAVGALDLVARIVLIVLHGYFVHSPRLNI